MSDWNFFSYSSVISSASSEFTTTRGVIRMMSSVRSCVLDVVAEQIAENRNAAQDRHAGFAVVGVCPE